MTATVKALEVTELESLVEKAGKEVVEMMTSVTLESVAVDDPAWEGGKGASFHGSIGLAGKYVGNLHVAIPHSTAKKLRNGMLGEESDELEGVADALGEIVNMLAGSVQTSLSSTDRAITLSIPSVLDSNDWPKQVGSSGLPTGLKRYRCEAGPIEIALQLIPNEKA